MRERGTSLSRRRWVVALALLMACIGMVVSLTSVGFELEEDLGLGALFRLRGARAAPEDVVLVRFDRDSFARFGALPDEPSFWPGPLRGCAGTEGGFGGLSDATHLGRLPYPIHACLVRELSRRGAAVIAFDATAFRDDRDRDNGWPALARAIREHGRTVLIEQAIRSGPAHGKSKLSIPQVDRLEGPHAELSAAPIGTATFVLPRSDERQHRFWAFDPALSEPTQLPVRAIEALAAGALARLAAAEGHAAPLEWSPGDRLRHHLVWFVGRLARTRAPLPPLPVRDAELLRALARIHDGPDGYYLNFYGPPGAFASASAADLLAPEPGQLLDARLAKLAGKIVLVGYAERQEPRASDSFPSPFSVGGIDLSGVEIAATAVANLLHDDTVRAPPEWARLPLVGLIGFALTLASCAGTVGRGLAATVVLAGTYAGIVVAAFGLANLWLPAVVPLLLLLPLSLALRQLVHRSGAARWLTIYTPRLVGRQRLQGRELAPDLGRRREVTVLMTDIVGFTGLAERTTPEALTRFVNQHFTMLTACVEAEAGQVGQFVGDSMMAFWGAPDPQRDHAARACRAALAIRRALEEDNRRRARAGQPPIHVRIGINTGVVTAGNVGAPGRSSYGIVGVAVNTTQRIEQLGKLVCEDLPTVAILASAITREKAGDAFLFADAGVHLVRGRTEDVRIFRLEDLVEALPAGRRLPVRRASPTDSAAA